MSEEVRAVPQGTSFRRTEATQLRDLEALRLRATGQTLEAIGTALGEHRATVKRRVDRLLAEVKFDAVDEYRALVLARLEAATARVTEVLYAQHVHVNDGRIVRDDAGTALLDP